MLFRSAGLRLVEARYRWNCALGISTIVNADFRQAADRLAAEGVAWLNADVLVPLLPKQLRGRTPAEVAAHYRVARLTLLALEKGGRYQAAKIAAGARESQSTTDAALAVLAEAGLIAVNDGAVSAAVTPPKRAKPLDRAALFEYPVPAVTPAPAATLTPQPKTGPTPQPPRYTPPAPPPYTPSAPLPKTSPTSPRPALTLQRSAWDQPAWELSESEPEPKPTATPEPEPEPKPPTPEPGPEPKPPTPEPEPEPKPPPVAARVTTRTLAATLAPRPAADENVSDEAALLRRIAHAAEISAGLDSAPTRVRTPLGVNPLLDTQLRIAVVLCGVGRPMMASELSAYHLTPEQKRFLSPALAEGVRKGGFISTGGGRSGRGRLYSLADVTVFDGVSWEALHAAVEAQREARERRKLGSGASATR